MKKVKTMFVVINDTKEDVYGNVYSTRLNAQIAIANYIRRQIASVHVDEVRRDLKKALAKKEYNTAMEIWNAWCCDTESWDTFSIQVRKLNEPLPS
jgi:hypothetical protein